MRHHPAVICMLGIILLLTACSTAVTEKRATPSPSSQPLPTDSLTPHDCWFPTNGYPVTCGFLGVPEDRTLTWSRPLRLAVAILKTTASHPSPDPIIVLQGGPGGRLIQDLAPYVLRQGDDLTYLFGNHDVILVDQRGAGYSQPSLQCNEITQLQYQTNSDGTSYDTALSDCHTRLTSMGINLNDYNTLNNATDIHDLIHALHYHQVDLYGVSYGTRLALEMMHLYPQDIRSVILDSTFPPQINLFTSYPAAVARVYNVLFQGCAASTACNALYPQLASVFYGLVQKLNEVPITLRAIDPATQISYQVKVWGTTLADLVYEGLYVTTYIPALPRLIYQVQKGDYTDLLARFYGAFYFGDGVSEGVYYSVECAEDVAFVTDQDLANAAQAFPAALRDNDAANLEAILPECQLWNVHPAPASEKIAVVSNIPTLILEGEYDPITPPTNGDLAAQTLSQSDTLRFPGMGHGVFIYNFDAVRFRCPISIVRAFQDDPLHKPDARCIAQMSEPFG